MYFKKRYQNKTLPPVSTASLPDIVFMLLFFFMTVTTVKNQNIIVENNLPIAEQISKLEKKDRVIEIFVGKPNQNIQDKYGNEPVIQLDTKIKRVDEVADYVLAELAKKPEGIRNLVTVSLKVDQDASLGLVTDIKEQLREINVLKINYTTIEGDSFKNSTR